MDTENDLRLSPSEWETLKAIGGWNRDHRLLDNNAVRTLVASELAIVTDNGPAITAMGRRVVVRGSPQLWNS
ncbi:MAG: hypothetical protein J0H97_16435 [Alphaproteobacteria bacterium]|mgnify:CR=1 FL=1|jgi:hypothetical protein|nr:hypothetical protein [Alphaproteobacteria bacterium]